MYSPDEWEILAEVNSVSCITILSLIFGRKVAMLDGPIHYGQGLLLVLYGIAWAISLIACMLTSTNNGNFISCSLTFYNCTLLYTVFKVTLYMHFVEKIYVISATRAPRYRCPLYITNICLMIPHIAIFVLLTWFRVTSVRDEFPYHCSIGHELPATVAVLCYDVFVASLYTGIFVKYWLFPNTAQQTDYQATNLYIMARHSLLPSIMAIVSAIVNYCIMLWHQGEERGLVLSSIITLCVTVLCCCIHWVTSHPSEIQFNEKILHRGNGEKPVKLEIKQHQEVVILTELNTQA